MYACRAHGPSAEFRSGEVYPDWVCGVECWFDARDSIPGERVVCIDCAEIIRPGTTAQIVRMAQAGHRRTMMAPDY